MDIDPETARVLVGDEEDLVRGGFEVDRVNWLDEVPSAPTRVLVKIRYAHPGTGAVLESLPGGRARVRLESPQRAVTPGQAAVFYAGDRVMGGGWIVRQPSVL